MKRLAVHIRAAGGIVDAKHTVRENGLIGFAGFMTLISCFIGYSFKRFWQEGNPYALMMCASALALVLQGLTEYNFGNGAVM